MTLWGSRGGDVAKPSCDVAKAKLYVRPRFLCVGSQFAKQGEKKAGKKQGHIRKNRLLSFGLSNKTKFP